MKPSAVPRPELPAPQPALLRLVAVDVLRWDCLRLIEALKDDELSALFPEPPDEFADLAGEFAELVVSGIGGDRPRAALAAARIEGRDPALVLSAGERQLWLERWAAVLRRRQPQAAASKGLWLWMAALTLRWLAAGESAAVAAPLDLYRR